MTLHTSYFYQIRFFKPYMIPFSTAVWDPKWYHDFRPQTYNFIDKNGVLNGLRIKNFMPGKSCENLCRGPEFCSTGDPETCEFLKAYEKQLQALDPVQIERYFEYVCQQIQKSMGLQCNLMPVLIVHEAPTKACSERSVILKVMNEKGIPTTELKYPIDSYY